jgi:hypothetical protein
MEEHRHDHTLTDDDGNEVCSCGVKICDARSPDRKYGCTLKKGHSDPHMNTWAPEYGTWN